MPPPIACPKPCPSAPGNPLGRFTPLVSPLEGRSLLSGNLVGREMPVNARVDGAQELSGDGGRSIDVTGEGTVIAAWATTDVDGSRIVARRIGAGGSPLGAEFPVSTTQGGTRGDAVVESNGQDAFVVAWEGRGDVQDPSRSGVFARTFSSDGTPLSDEFRVNASVVGDQEGPSIAWVSPTRFVVTWSGAGRGRASRSSPASSTRPGGGSRTKSACPGRLSAASGTPS